MSENSEATETLAVEPAHNDPPPSWFAKQGVPACSKWGKTGIEYLAWAYVVAQARDGDTWHEVTPEKAYELLTEDERHIVGGFTQDGTLCHLYIDWWAMIGRHLRDAAGAFEVGGLAWTRCAFNQDTAETEEPSLRSVVPYRFTVGEIYELQNGKRVIIVARHTKCRGHETVVDENGVHRYDRSTSSDDAGRVTGTPHDFSHPENIKREQPKQRWLRKVYTSIRDALART